jgi:hypothetical protein
VIEAGPYVRAFRMRLQGIFSVVGRALSGSAALMEVMSHSPPTRFSPPLEARETKENEERTEAPPGALSASHAEKREIAQERPRS